jgi:Mg2+/Co2+ transporter CorB
MVKRLIKIIGGGALCLLVTALPAEAGVVGKMAAVFSGDVIALIVSAVAALLAGVFGIMFVRVARTFREAGEFLTTLGCALEDRRISREELAAIIREGRDIFVVWK